MADSTLWRMAVFFFFLFIEVGLIYIVLVSGIQLNDSGIQLSDSFTYNYYFLISIYSFLAVLGLHCCM